MENTIRSRGEVCGLAFGSVGAASTDKKDDKQESYTSEEHRPSEEPQRIQSPRVPRQRDGARPRSDCEEQLRGGIPFLRTNFFGSNP